MNITAAILPALLAVNPQQDPASTPATQPGLVLVVPILDSLAETHVALAIRGYREAKAQSASAVLFEIDTPGGEVTLMDRIIEQIETAPEIPTAAFVTQRAASAGSLIAISCNRIYMRPGSHIGSARPITMLPFPLPDVPELDKVRNMQQEHEEKMVSDFRAHFRAKAQRTGRNQAIAEAMVDQKIIVYEIELEGIRDYVTEREYREKVELHGADRVHMVREICSSSELLNLTASDAYDIGFIDAIVQTRADVLRQLNLENARVLELQSSWSEILASQIQSFGWLLFILGLLFLFVELKVPGFGIPGILGICCFALLLFGKYLSGLAEATEILLIVFGLGLVASELFFFQGMLIPGILGVLSILAGLVLSFQSFTVPTGDAPPWAVAEWWSNLRTLGWAFCGGLLTMFLLAHFLPHIPILNRIALKSQYSSGSLRGSGALLDDVHRNWRPEVGARGISSCPLRPAGKIEIDGRQVDAVAEGQFVENGVEVQVVRLEGNRIVVRPTT
jgi:membrane-bound serine protease (ClpP class)